MLCKTKFFLCKINSKLIKNYLASLSNLSIVLGILSSLFGVLYSIYLKKTLQPLENNLYELNYFLNLISVLILLPVSIMFGEAPNLFGYELLYSPYFWFLMTLSGLVGFLLGLAVTFQMHHTQPLTANISGVSKSCLQTLMGVFWFDEHKTLLWWTSNGFVLLGATAYAFVRHAMMK